LWSRRSPVRVPSLTLPVTFRDGEEVAGSPSTTSSPTSAAFGLAVAPARRSGGVASDPRVDRHFENGDNMTVTDELLQNNERYAEGFDKGELPLPPGKALAVVACMDARLHVSKILGLEEGDAHVIRNAGGVVTADEIRSLSISQRLLGTSEIILMHHTDCGMLTFKDDEFRRQIQEETGVRPEWAAEAFSDLDDDVRQNIARIKASPFIPNKDSIRGFVYEVETGRLREVTG
jgi:carbonic anhydrase